jgi:hypothetical protein
MDLPYLMWDADNHLYEGVDAFTRYLPAARQRDVYWVHDAPNHSHIIMGGAEGLAESTDFVKGVADFFAADQRRIMRDNLAALLGRSA